MSKFLDELENAGITTILTKDGVIYNLGEACKKFKTSYLIKNTSYIYYYDGVIGNSLLKNLGLTGHWGLIKKDK